jgi:hypothetical protein
MLPAKRHISRVSGSFSARNAAIEISLCYTVKAPFLFLEVIKNKYNSMGKKIKFNILGRRSYTVPLTALLGMIVCTSPTRSATMHRRMWNFMVCGHYEHPITLWHLFTGSTGMNYIEAPLAKGFSCTAQGRTQLRFENYIFIIIDIAREVSYIREISFCAYPSFFSFLKLFWDSITEVFEEHNSKLNMVFYY